MKAMRNRVIELRMVRASDIAVNPRNWRKHSNAQRDAFRTIAAEIGFAGAELCYISERNGGALTLVDGQMRKEECGDNPLPCLVTDLSDDEADRLLAAFDPLSTMATTDHGKLAELLKTVETKLSGAGDLLNQIRDGGAAVQNVVREDSPELQRFIEQREASRRAGQDKGEVNFWVCLVFQSWDQKQEFLKQLDGVAVLYGMYADGESFAKNVGKPVTPNACKAIASPLDKRLAELVIPKKEGSDHGEGEE